MNTTLQVITINNKPSKQMTGLVCTAIFTIIGLVLLYFEIYFLGAAIAFGGGFGFYSLKKTSRQAGNMMQLDSKGLEINMPNMAHKLLWKDIEGFDYGQVVGFDQVLVYLKEPEEYLEKMKLNKITKKLWKENLKNLGTFILVNTVTLDMKTPELIELLKHYKTTTDKRLA